MARPPMISLGRSRVALGRDIRLIDAHTDHIWLEGIVRLRPGQALELVGEWPGLAPGRCRARVVTWRVVRLTSEGPYYRGCCRAEA